MRRFAPLLAFALIVSLLTASSTVAGQATPAATPMAAREEALSFESGPDTLYGTLQIPEGLDAPAPAALIISGSGPTDRNGDNPVYALGTNRHIAADLAEIGVVSFRYDKLGSGATRLASHPAGEGVDYELFLQEAWDAFDVLAARPEVDAERIVVIGHSEGALFALEMATDREREIGPAGIVLAAPVGVRYLDLIAEQIEGAYEGLVDSGSIPAAQAEQLNEELAAAIADIREQGAPEGQLSDPAVAQLLHPLNLEFLRQIDQRDPAALAGDIPVDMPVLILHGLKDEQVTVAIVDPLAEAFERDQRPDYVRVEIPDANHVFRVIEGEPNAQLDYANPSLPFSPEVGDALESWFDAVR